MIQGTNHNRYICNAHVHVHVLHVIHEHVHVLHVIHEDVLVYYMH